MFIVAKLLKYDEERNEIKTEQMSFVLFKDIMITFQEFHNSIFVDSYFLVLEKIDDRIDLLEEQLISNPEKEVLKEIYELKREMIYIKNYIWSLR